MKEGIVKFYNKTKGFGFIQITETNQDVFVHETGLKGRIDDGDKVRFNVENGQKGLKAIDVERIR